MHISSTPTLFDQNGTEPSLVSAVTPCERSKEGAHAPSLLLHPILSRMGCRAHSKCDLSLCASWSRCSVISGVGELDLDRNGEKSSSVTPVSSPLPANTPYTDCPYLLLDVRDREQYDQCHIITGRWGISMSITCVYCISSRLAHSEMYYLPLSCTI